MFEMKDGKERQTYDTGAMREPQDEKSRPDLISPFALIRVGEVMRKGAVKYADRNWEKGIPFSRFYASATRHLLQYGMGKKDEDHLAQCIFNLQAIIHFQELERKDLDDMPKYD